MRIIDANQLLQEFKSFREYLSLTAGNDNYWKGYIAGLNDSIDRIRNAPVILAFPDPYYVDWQTFCTGNDLEKEAGRRCIAITNAGNVVRGVITEDGDGIKEDGGEEHNLESYVAIHFTDRGGVEDAAD